MGFSISWFAIPEKNSEAFLARFYLLPTGEQTDGHGSLMATANLGKGWMVLWYNSYGCPFLRERELAEVSMSHDIIRCLVEEHVMASSAELWSGGKRKWFLEHEGEDGPKGLYVEGVPPDSFNSIRKEIESTQLAEGGDEADVDYIFEIPLLVAESIAGFKHDKIYSPENLFHVLKFSESRPGFFGRLLGKR